MGDETITTTILAGICVNIFYLRCKNIPIEKIRIIEQDKQGIIK